LAAFLAQHPEVAHNPAFFVGQQTFETDSGRGRALGVVRDIFEGVTVLIGFLGFFLLVGVLGRSIMQHRTWLRASKLQAEAHAKLVDRLTSNEDLLAYIGSAAGQRAMGSAVASRPLFDVAAHSVAAPVSRMLWAV